MAPRQQHEVTLDATPEEVWKLLTEAEGITRWFAPEARVEPGQGGKVFVSWGEGMGGECPIHIWEPNKVFGWDEGGKTVEFHLEGGGGRTKLRLVQSGFGDGGKFDDEYDAVNGGWRTFIAALEFGLQHHAKDACVQVASLRMVTAARDQVIDRMTAVLEVHPPLDKLRVGDSFKANLGALGHVSGKRLEPGKPGYCLLTLDEWNHSIFALFVEIFGESLAVTQQWWLFGDAAHKAESLRPALLAWQEQISKDVQP